MFNNCSTFFDVSDIIKKVASSEGQKALQNKLESQKRFQVLASKKILKAKKIQKKKAIKKEELEKEIDQENSLKNKKPAIRFKLSMRQNTFAALVDKKKVEAMDDDKKVIVHEFSEELKERYDKWKEVKSQKFMVKEQGNLKYQGNFGLSDYLQRNLIEPDYRKKYREIDANPFKVDRFDEDLEQKLFKERDYFRVEMENKELLDDEADLCKVQAILRKHKIHQFEVKSQIEQQYDLFQKRSKTIFKILNAAIKRLLDDKKMKSKRKGKKRSAKVP